jgi:hypothetical protein
MSLSVGDKLGPYEIVGLLGAGGMARSIGPAIRASAGTLPSKSPPKNSNERFEQKKASSIAT